MAGEYSKSEDHVQSVKNYEKARDAVESDFSGNPDLLQEIYNQLGHEYSVIGVGP